MSRSSNPVRRRPGPLAWSLSLALALAGCGTATGSGPSGSTSGTPAAAPFSVPVLPSPVPHDVMLLAINAQSGGKLHIRYEIGAELTQHVVTGASSPWKLTAVAPPGASLIDLSIGADEHVVVTCLIEVDGTVVVQHSAYGAIGCHYVFP